MIRFGASMEVEGTLVGRTLAGRFRIERCIGRGGMATVYAARVESGEGQGDEVALKVVNRELTRDPMVLKRFHREAKAASRLKHRNTVQVYEYGVDGSDAFIAMELAQGVDLLQALAAENPMRQARAALIVAQVCAALSVAHAAGIIHRDLKPENVMLVPDATEPGGELVKVLDFGIAKIVETAAVRGGASEDEPPSYVTKTALTRVGTIVGTPAYMSPEQCRGGELDGRSDVYSCGVLLFQILTGEVPFTGETPLHTAMRHIHAQPKPPSELRPGLAPVLEKVVLKALAKWPGERHQTAEQMRAELIAALPELPDRGPRDLDMLMGREGGAAVAGTAATELLIQADPRMVHGALGAGKLGSVRLSAAPAKAASAPGSDEQRTRERRPIARAATGATPTGATPTGPTRSRTGATPTGASAGASGAVMHAAGSAAIASAATLPPQLDADANDEPRTQERRSTAPQAVAVEAPKVIRERAPTERAPTERAPLRANPAAAPVDSAARAARAQQSWARPTAQAPAQPAVDASTVPVPPAAEPRKSTLRGAFPSTTDLTDLGAAGRQANPAPGRSPPAVPTQPLRQQQQQQQQPAAQAEPAPHTIQGVQPTAGRAASVASRSEYPARPVERAPRHSTETGLTPTAQIPAHVVEKEVVAQLAQAALDVADDDEPETFIRNPPPQGNLPPQAMANPASHGDEEEPKRAVHQTLVMDEEVVKRGSVAAGPSAAAPPAPTPSPAPRDQASRQPGPASRSDAPPRGPIVNQMSAAAIAKTVDAAVAEEQRAALDAAYDEGMKRQLPAASPLRSTLASAKSGGPGPTPGGALPPPAGYAEAGDVAHGANRFQNTGGLRPVPGTADEFAELAAPPNAPMTPDAGFAQVKATVRMSPDMYADLPHSRGGPAIPYSEGQMQQQQRPIPYPVGLQRPQAQGKSARGVLEGMSATTVLLIGMGAGVVFVVVVLATIFIVTHR